MGIEEKHAYRFGYLKSEAWVNVRIEALAREKGKCQICGEVSISNDAHHIWYPENIYETKQEQLAVLCRPCHNFVHAMLPECKTSDPVLGQQMWNTFLVAVSTWRVVKAKLFIEQHRSTMVAAYNAAGIGLNIPARALRDELLKLKKRIVELENDPVGHK